MTSLNNKLICQWCKSNHINITKVFEKLDKWDGKQKEVTYYCMNKKCKFNGTKWIQSINL